MASRGAFAVGLLGVVGLLWLAQSWSMSVFVIVGVALTPVVLYGWYASDSSKSGQIAPSLATTIMAGAAVFGIWQAWSRIDDWSAAGRWAGLGFLFVVMGYFVWMYLEHRRNVATASTAVNRMRRTVRRDISDWSEFATGIVIVALASVLAVVSGALGALQGLGEVLLPFAPEIAYITTVAVGYAQLGGEFAGSGFIPDLNSMQWLGITLMSGFIALVVRDA